MVETSEYKIAVILTGEVAHFNAKMAQAAESISGIVNHIKKMDTHFGELMSTISNYKGHLFEIVDAQQNWEKMMKAASDGEKLYKKQLDDTYKTVMKLSSIGFKKGFNINSYLKSISSGLGMFRSDIKITEARIRRFANSFQYWGLSVMFFGMQVQRIFGGILKSTVSSFTKIMESSGFLGTSIQQLSVHWEYLKFVVGSALNRALEPLLPYIINIIRNITEWVNKHPKLTAEIILGGVALGAFLSVVGELSITLGPLLKMLMAPLGLLGLLGSIAAITIGTLGFDAIKKFFDENPDLLKPFLEDIKSMMSGPLKDLKDTLGSLTIDAFPDLGKTLVWLGALTVRVFAAIVDGFTAFINLIKVAVSGLDALLARTELFMIDKRKQPKRYLELLDIKKETGERFMKNLDELLSFRVDRPPSDFMDIFLKGPTGYMEYLRAKTGPQYTPMPPNFQPVGGGNPIYITNFYNSNENMSKVLQEIKGKYGYSGTW